MIIVPGAPPVEETRHSRELGRRIEEVVRDYQRDNPDVSLSDVRLALTQKTPGGASSEVIRRKRAAVAVVAALVAVAFGVLAGNGGRIDNNSATWRIIGAVVALCAVTFAVIRTARRND